MSQQDVLLDSEHFAEAFYVAAFVDFRVGGSMCHAEAYLVKKGNLCKSAQIFYPHSSSDLAGNSIATLVSMGFDRTVNVPL